jgi:hypothetical protein
MDVWLAGGKEREKMFAPFCSGYRIYRQEGSNRVAIVSEGVDLQKMQAAMSSPEIQAGAKAHTVLEPWEVFVEIEGGK